MSIRDECADNAQKSFQRSIVRARNHRSRAVLCCNRVHRFKIAARLVSAISRHMMGSEAAILVISQRTATGLWVVRDRPAWRSAHTPAYEACGYWRRAPHRDLPRHMCDARACHRPNMLDDTHCRAFVMSVGVRITSLPSKSRCRTHAAVSLPAMG